MKGTIAIGLLSFLAGSILVTSLYEFTFMPLRMKRMDSYSLGTNDMRDQLIERVQKEFGRTETVTPLTPVLISGDKKVVVIKTVNGVKTVKVYER